MKFVVDQAIPFLRGVLEKWGEVSYLAGVSITAEDVRDADALIVRTRTRCNASLLEGSRVKFIATATIGFDHIDLKYCAEHDIKVVTSAGCNARGVLQWVSAVLRHLSLTQGWMPQQRTLAIVGVGHVGSLVKEYSESWGFRVVCCDPPREEREHLGFLSLEEVARQADIITFHTPLADDTRHMINRELLSWLKPDAVVLNSSRGEVLDTEALVEDGHPCAMDVWEHEPNISREILERAIITTPHIAGYSEQGKAIATSMALQQLGRHFGLPFEGWYPAEAAPQRPCPISWEEMCQQMGEVYDIVGESQALKQHPDQFEWMRDHYNYRSEFF